MSFLFTKRQLEAGSLAHTPIHLNSWTHCRSDNDLFDQFTFYSYRFVFHHHFEEWVDIFSQLFVRKAKFPYSYVDVSSLIEFELHSSLLNLIDCRSKVSWNGPCFWWRHQTFWSKCLRHSREVSHHVRSCNEHIEVDLTSIDLLKKLNISCNISSSFRSFFSLIISNESSNLHSLPSSMRKNYRSSHHLVVIFWICSCLYVKFTCSYKLRVWVLFRKFYRIS